MQSSDTDLEAKTADPYDVLYDVIMTRCEEEVFGILYSRPAADMN